MTTTTQEPRTHRLKIWPEFYREHLEGRRPFEIRKNDRFFEVGDTVILLPYSPESNAFLPGDPLQYRVSTVSNFQQRLDYVVLGLQKFCDGNHRGPRCSDPECWQGIDTAMELYEIDLLLRNRAATDGLKPLEAIRVLLGVVQRTDANGKITKEIRDVVMASPELPDRNLA